MKHAEDVRPDVESWPAVEKKVRRNHYTRTVTASLATVVLIAAAAFLLPRVGRQTKPHGFIVNPTATEVPGQRYTIAPAAGKTTYIDPDTGWLLQYPTTWKTQVFEGNTEFFPPGLPSPERANSAAEVFVANVSIQNADFRRPWADFANAAVSQRAIQIGGVEATEVTVKDKPNGKQLGLAYQFACAEFGSGCRAGQLTVWISSDNQSFWHTYGAAARAIAQTIRPVAATTGSTGPLRTKHGSAPSFMLDDFSRTFLGFMDARAEGAGAEDFMCCDAPNSYASLGGLYQINGKAIVSYVVQYDPSAGSTTDHRVGVEITYADGPHGELIDVVRQADGTYKIASMCNACGEK